MIRFSVLTRVDWITVCAPIVLAVLGAWISVRPPTKKYHWFVAFVLVLLGGAAAAAASQIKQARIQDQTARGKETKEKEALQSTIEDLRREIGVLSTTSIPTLMGDVKGLGRPPVKPADLTLRFVHPDEVAIVVTNAPHAGLADRPKYYVQLVNLDNPSDFLRIPTQMGDYIRPGEFMGPNQFMGLDAVKAVVKPGDRIFGSVGVSCPTCVKSRSYWLYIKVGDGGWFEEQEGPPKGIANLNAARSIAENFEAYADFLAPTAKRISIKQTFDSTE